MRKVNQTIIKKSDLINNISTKGQHLDERLVDESVREILGLMGNVLCHDGRIEVRGFGSFCLHHRQARKARNPKTGDIVEVGAKAVPYFKPGKALRELVNNQ